MHHEPLTIPPGTYRISETILMTDPSWKSVMRAALGTGEQHLRRGGEAGGDGGTGNAFAEHDSTFAAE